MPVPVPVPAPAPEEEAVAAPAPATQMMFRRQLGNAAEASKVAAECFMVPATCECMEKTPIARRLCVASNVAYSVSGFAHALAAAPCAAAVCGAASTGLCGIAAAFQVLGCLSCNCYES